MTPRCFLSAILLVSSSISGKSAEPAVVKGSLGPLQRIDASGFTAPGLLAVHGEPLLGLPGPAGERMQRIGDADQWLVESGNLLSRIEWDREKGDMRLREILRAQAEWCLSPDGKRLFAMRWSAEMRRSTWECFDVASGASVWMAPVSVEPSDAIFSQDGRSLIVLHAMPEGTQGGGTAVSWWDAETGEPRRQVKLPGGLYSISGAIVTDYLAESDRGLYVAPPRENEVPEGWFLPADGGEPVRLTWDPSSSDELANVRVGGEHRELLAVYTGDVLELFREADQGPPVRLCQVDISMDSSNLADKNVRFAPDHRQLLVADCEKTLLISIKPPGEPEIKRLKGGNHLGDFTKDGRFFVSVDDGGGVIRDRLTLERADKAKLREFPAHCCPIADAGFSITGRWIISNDKRSLLLWTREGEILAELASPNEEGKARIEMQSPLVIERLSKVYAADGWNFIEWDLNEVAERRKKFPGFQPRVVGKVVFSDLKAGNDGPEHMSLGMNASGTRLITATRRTFIYRSLEEPAETTRLQVAKLDVFMRPREIHIPEQGGEVLVKSASELFGLDPEGKKAPRVLSTQCAAEAGSVGRTFDVLPMGGQLVVVAKPFGATEPGEDRMVLPAEWTWVNSRLLRATPDGRWLLAMQAGPASKSVGALLAIDWSNKKIVREIPLNWLPTTVELSADGSRLLIGAFNRSLYEFDLKQLCAEP